MFPPTTFNKADNDAFCKSEYGLYPHYDWALDFYGGITDAGFASYSNIFLSNGDLDPWNGGGVYFKNEKMDFNFVKIPLAAHHLDLRTPNPADPVYV
mmetsp:Transcript_12270/g.1846  ORF Transcript_12270/g.1846 Transcript_12270/m.1846 type:complete len:97 (+) Transcript_12270:111-401(+)